MKSYYLAYIMTAVAMTSCYHAANVSEEDVIETDESVSKRFTFHVKGDFQAIYNDMDDRSDNADGTRSGDTRAAIRLEENNSAGITDIWVLDYDGDGKLVQQMHQTSADQDFGHPTMDLTYGHHDIRFVASKGSSPVLNATNGTASTDAKPHTITWAKVKDTYALDYPVDVVISTNGNRAPELARYISGIKLKMTDVVPSGATSIAVTMTDHYSSLVLHSLTVVDEGSSTTTFALSSADAGKTITFNVYTIAPDDTWVSDVTVNAYAGSSLLTTITIPNVELKRNRMTELIGEVFARGNGFSISVEDDWDTTKQITF